MEILFHHPGPVEPGGSSGSQVRPWQMLRAFVALGYDVERVTGYGVERREKIRRLEKDIKKGRRFEFVYSESRTTPTLLTERKQIPIHPVMEFGFLRDLRNMGIPTGLFYRDIYWRFNGYTKTLAWWRRSLNRRLYQYDWWWYERMVDHLFLPSLGMARFLPNESFTEHLSALPPGALIRDDISVTTNVKTLGRKLRMLYVGGVKPPSYDLRPLFMLVKELRALELTLCCRRSEWEQSRHLYQDLISSRIEIKHLASDALAAEYVRSDVFPLVREPDEYLDFAVPVKLFEAMSFGLPLLALNGTEAARTVEQEGLGWVVGDLDEAKERLVSLLQNPELVFAARQRSLDARPKHSWKMRAIQVKETLLDVRRQFEAQVQNGQCRLDSRRRFW